MKSRSAPPLWFFILLGIAVCKRFLFHPLGNAMLDNYLLDILCIPIVMEGCRWILENLLKRTYRFTVYHCIVAVLYFSLVFELLLPKLGHRFHSDIFDVVCYGASTAIWYICQPKLKINRIDAIKNA